MKVLTEYEKVLCQNMATAINFLRENYRIASKSDLNSKANIVISMIECIMDSYCPYVQDVCVN